MHPKDAAGIANSVDPDQTDPLGWSALFAIVWAPTLESFAVNRIPTSGSL